ncbi:MAG: M28 family peptidase [Acidobacteriota bacterium]|nr:M28 family peptidase [Acidobacteriota bacterium]
MKMLLGAVLLFAVACAEAPPRAPEQAQSPASPVSHASPASAASPAVDGERAFEHVKQMVAIGPRPAGSPAIERTRAYITSQIEAMGLKVEPQRFMARTPVGQVAMSNLRVTLPGTRPGRIVIGSHYDTKPEKTFVFVGANDAGSSTGLLIELARVLKDSPREFTYELVFFDGEEAWGDWASGNTFGSRHYVDAARSDGTVSGVKAMILLDMVGERGVQLRQDMSSTGWLNDIVWRTAARLGHQRTFLAETTAVDDDHIPFIRAGIPAIDLIDLDYPAWHTAGDTLDKLDPRSLQIVGEVVVAALPAVEARLKTGR